MIYMEKEDLEIKMFSIKFIHGTSFNPQLSNIKAGEIIIGELRECFHSSLSYWSQEQYTKQWKEGIDRVCIGEETSALIIDMYDPNSSNIIQWWILRCNKDLVNIRHELLFLSDCDTPFIEENIYSYIKTAKKNESKKISEWELNISDIRQAGQQFV
jgi:CdiI N-terminal domain